MPAATDQKRTPDQQAELGSMTVLSSAMLWRQVARDTSGKNVMVSMNPHQLGRLSPWDCMQLFLLVPEIFGLIAGRALRFSGISWSIESESSQEDRLVREMRDDAMRFREFIEREEPIYRGHAAGIWARLLMRLGGDLFPDLSNFEGCLKRWSHAIQFERADRTSEIEDYFNEPVRGNLIWQDYAKQWSLDMLIFGGAASFLIPGASVPVSGFRTLPGGTVYPESQEYTTDVVGYVQYNYFAGQLMHGGGARGFIPQYYAPHEIIYAHYLPMDWQAPGLRPLDAVIEQAISLQKMQGFLQKGADGTRPPEKLVVFGRDPVGFAPLDNGPDSEKDPIEPEEQERIEEVLNSSVKDLLVRVLTRTGKPIEVDLSKSDMLPSLLAGFAQMIKPALVTALQATPAELGDVDSVQGRTITEIQQNEMMSKGLMPLISSCTNEHTLFIRQYFGRYEFVMQPVKTQSDKIRDARDASGIIGIAPNEIRTRVLGWEPDDADGMDEPRRELTPEQQGQQQQQDSANGMIEEMRNMIDAKLAQMGVMRK